MVAFPMITNGPERAPKAYVPRHVDHELDALFPDLAAIALDGPRGVGKTVTARRRAATVLRLDRESDRSLVEAAPEIVIDGEPPVLVDEWQRFPESWDWVRRAVDDGAPTGS